MRRFLCREKESGGAVVDGRAPATDTLLSALQRMTAEMQTIVHIAFLDGVRAAAHLEEYPLDEFTVRVLHGEFWPARSAGEYMGCVPHTVAAHLASSIEAAQQTEGLTLASLFSIPKETCSA